MNDQRNGSRKPWPNFLYQCHSLESEIILGIGSGERSSYQDALTLARVCWFESELGRATARDRTPSFRRTLTGKVYFIKLFAQGTYNRLGLPIHLLRNRKVETGNNHPVKGNMTFVHKS